MIEVAFALGVIAGEGTFTVKRQQAGDRTYLTPYFQVRMNECDTDLIRACRDAMDVGDLGTLRVADAEMFNWRIENKDDLLELTEVIEEKAPDIWWESEKAKNFDVWADIVRIYADGQTTAEQRVEMATLAQEGLNNEASNAKSDDDWQELIDIFEEQT